MKTDSNGGETRLKPIVFIKSKYPYNQENEFKQNLLLKALQITHNPKALKEMIGVRSVADVYRTWFRGIHTSAVSNISD